MRLFFIIEEEYRHDRMPLRVANQLAAWGHDIHLLHPQASATCLSALARVGTDRFDAYVLKAVIARWAAELSPTLPPQLEGLFPACRRLRGS